MIVLSRSKNAAARLAGARRGGIGGAADTIQEPARPVTMPNAAPPDADGALILRREAGGTARFGLQLCCPDPSGRGSARPPGAEPLTAPANPPWRGPSHAPRPSRVHRSSPPV